MNGIHENKLFGYLELIFRKKTLMATVIAEILQFKKLL